MTEFLTFDLNQAYAEIKERGQSQAVTNKEAWNALVEDYVNEKLGLGELDKDQDTEAIEDALQAKWTDYEKNLLIK